MTRLLAAIASLALCGAALAPIVRPPDDDGFPLSTYPMFAAPRPRELTMASARGVTRDGQPRTLSPGDLGTGEVMQAFTTLQHAAAAGAASCAALCATVAARVAGDAELADVVAVEIVLGRYDAASVVASGNATTEDQPAVLARCDVARSDA
jgi:hypothetical protein